MSDTKHTLKKEQLKNSCLSLACGGGVIEVNTTIAMVTAQLDTNTFIFTFDWNARRSVKSQDCFCCAKPHTHTHTKPGVSSITVQSHGHTFKHRISELSFVSECCLQKWTNVDSQPFLMTFNVSFLCVCTSRSLSLARLVYVIVAATVCIKAPRITGAII